jgi:hypothetical protein
LNCASATPRAARASVVSGTGAVAALNQRRKKVFSTIATVTGRRRNTRHASAYSREFVAQLPHYCFIATRRHGSTPQQIAANAKEFIAQLTQC